MLTETITKRKSAIPEGITDLYSLTFVLLYEALIILYNQQLQNRLQQNHQQEADLR